MSEPAICSKCGTPIAPGQRFCAGCGADVSGQQGNVATAFVPKQDMVRATMSQTALHDVVRHATIGEYEILAELGRGGMATVYLGHDIALDRKVAIKVMSPALLTGDGMVERFKREARTAASLSHPNIIPIYAVKEGDQIVYFVMKFVEGRPLDSIIKETGKLPIQMVQQILQQVGAGLGYAHKRGIIHRDVKPANVMVDTEGWAVVTDFGIAKVTETKGLTMTGATVGTPSYMSPEQCAAKELTGASDQYSLGVMAYEMLAGKLPFNADSIMAIMYSHFNDPPPPIDEVRPDCPPEIVTAVMRMLAKEPAERFPTVEDAISAIGVPAMTPDDPVRTQLMTLAASNKNTEMLKRLTTPVSMPGRTQAAKTTVSTTGG
ncbi:MAG TPA: serine/threonine-protein kinase, partial [Gemmatimonadales bacterium]|nr:serine/threonine-protein kinase [Gemmatimonadales bacterium]